MAAGDSNGDHARWRNGELIAPLPADPARRAEAIRQAKQTRRPLESSPSLTSGAATMTIGPTIEPSRVLPGIPARVAPGVHGRSAPRIQRPLLPPLEASPPSSQQLGVAERDPGIVVDPSLAPARYGAMGWFGAIDYTGWTPASPDIAAGPRHILVATTDEFAVYDKCGGLLYGGAFGDYYPLGPNYVYDEPRVIYDDWSGRWIMAYTANDFESDYSYVKFAISVGADLEDGWICSYSAPLATAGSFADNVHMAVDPEGLYFTLNQFNFNTYTFEGARIAALNKEDLYGCSATSIVFWDGLLNSDASPVVAVRPAQMRSYGGRMYFLNNKYQGGDFFSLWAIEDPFGPSPITYNSTLGVSAYAPPPRMIQPNGTYVDAGDCRVADVVYQNNRLRAAFSRNTTSNFSGVTLIGIQPFVTVDGMVTFGATGWSYAYPALDVDEHGRIGLTYALCSQASSWYLSMYSLVYDWTQGTIVDQDVLAVGRSDFTLGGSGTIGNPYRWGNGSGCAIDPSDDRTFWVYGAYTPDDPVPSWTTLVAAISGLLESDLEFEPEVSVTGGVQGRPFVKEVLPVTLSNTGETNLNWTMGTYPAWITPSAMAGEIAPFGTQEVSLFLNEQARQLPPGVYSDNVWFRNCTGSVATTCSVDLHIVEPITCPTAAISLEPAVGDTVSLFGSDEYEYSLFVTALEDIDVCAIGLMLVEPEPETVTCSVYHADGNTRGALLYSNSQIAVQDADGIYLVPMETSLQECQDYEIVFSHPGSIAHATYDENDFSYPFDANGVVRVRQSASNGSVADPWHPAVVLFAHGTCDRALGHTTDLYPDAAEHTEASTDAGQGLFITARENLYLCSVGFEADLVRDRWLSTRIWKATGNVRGDLIAEGFTPVTAGGLAQHEIPVHAFIEAGQDYNISVDISEKGYWPAVAEGEVTLPYTVDGDIDVRKGEYLGAASSNLPHIWLNWEEIGVRGAPFNLAKPGEGIHAPNSGSGAIDHGVFVQPSTQQQIYSLGVYADIPEGTTVTARIYRLTITGLRGPLQAEGSIESGGPGMRWHDVPLSFSWGLLGRFDLSIVCANSNEYGYWLDTTGMPYSPNGGVLQVQDAEVAGNAAGTELIHLRVNACNEALTGVGDGPPPFNAVRLESPVPNPGNGRVIFRYAVDAPGAADLEIYDVAGRRVVPVFTGRHIDAGPGEVEFDTSGLAGGVYFLKLTANAKVVSRKIVVVR